jgi:hypothetical protein
VLILFICYHEMNSKEPRNKEKRNELKAKLLPRPVAHLHPHVIRFMRHTRRLARSVIKSTD